MKYWIFQNNQVLGPYEPDEMGKISVFSPESLVCPEGRRGTSMGDWQRAGMVPDLSVALVRASATQGKTATLSIAGLPPEPTLKDLAQLGSLQEKVAMLEEVALQLQEGLRAKDAELTTVHQELAGKAREASEIKLEAEATKREADLLKRQIAGLEERLASVKLLGETLDKAVEEERKVEADVEKQGETLAALAKELEELRAQLAESRRAPPEPVAPPSPIPAPAPVALAPSSAPPSGPAFEPPPASPFGELAPPPAAALEPAPAAIPLEPAPAPGVLPVVDFPTAAVSPVASPDAPAIPAPNNGPLPFDSSPFGAPGGLAPVPAGASDPAAALAGAEPEQFGVVAPPPAPAKGKKALLLGGALGVAALCAVAVMGGFVPGLNRPKPQPVVDAAPLPPPEPAPVPPPPDPRESAVEIAKAWTLPDGVTLERALEQLAPSAGNLSPWMAEPLAGSRVQVNYFARGTAAGAPTIAYEFEIDVDARTLVGRNAAAKAILTGKAAAPPAPPKPKPVKVKPKPKPAASPKPAEEETLDSMLGEESPEDSAPKPKAAAASSADPMAGEESGVTLTDPGDAPPAEDSLEPPSEETPRPRSAPAKRAAKAKGAKAPAAKKPADEALLDDLLQE